DVLAPLLKSKRKSTHAASEYELNGKLIRFALGRGFDMNIIKKCLEK
ncbi:MAG: RecX family transcriptional regulator, partial [Clostridia bacterium]|nr:RecX family transcriptional regulator [Clostridia bacterium]